jgi:iron complex outermembrane receptor protein
VRNLHLQLLEKYVSEQYLDNTQNKFRMLNSYQTLDARINYTIEHIVTREIHFGLMLNNITNEIYSSNGYTYPYFTGGKLISDNYLYPQAGFNVLGQITVKF